MNQKTIGDGDVVFISQTDYVVQHMMVPGVGRLTRDPDGIWRDARGEPHDVVLENGGCIILDGTVCLS